MTATWINSVNDCNGLRHDPKINNPPVSRLSRSRRSAQGMGWVVPGAGSNGFGLSLCHLASSVFRYEIRDLGPQVLTELYSPKRPPESNLLRLWLPRYQSVLKTHQLGF